MTEARVGSGKVTLFCQNKQESLFYRIPALLYLAPESTFLAFAEERSSLRDEDAKFLVMRRGLKKGTSVQWGPQAPLMTAALPCYRTMSPCPVYEKKSGTVFLFFICVLDHITTQCQILRGKNAARLCYVFSRDGGRTWSKTTDLTEEVIGEDLVNWATFAVGPGHGVQLSSGRLVIPAYAYCIHKRCFCCSFCCIKPHCFTFYSDDGGQNWAQGQLLESLKTTECQIAEVTLQDKSHILYLSARNSDRDHCRGEAFSKDNGVQFERPVLCRELSEPPHGCQGSIVSFTPVLGPSGPGQQEGAGNLTHLQGIHSSLASLKNSTSWLVFSHPTSKCKRLDLGIYLNASPLEKGSWRAPWLLYKGPSGYSDLAVCEEEKPLLFSCLFECGVSSECEEISFQLFTDAELLRNVEEGVPALRSPAALN
ncbi:sialidase-3-like [Hemicordylus capensis]|uniref:sialidase-3-like n=1 Tax=Hemicordylus capensis TaxID=884348 RepID=UPI0023020FAD|nr:sialidase-3-like [Hemicordylus capensis]XP_053168404.1 sialidase-3-like [Hemicordylus capensis]XP_053168405.1 sialidase-3-like [Hemicordylus capensis]